MSALTRRSLLARATGFAKAIAGAVVVTPVVGSIIAADTPEAPPEAETVYNWWQVTMSDGQLALHDTPEPPSIYGNGIPLAARNVLVRTMTGEIRRWGLDTGWEGWLVR